MTIIQPVVLSGGAGTRLWPLSRERHPKPLLRLLGANSLLQETVLRLDGLAAGGTLRAPIVVCNEEHRFISAEQLREAGRPARSLVLEPAGRNTAPALCVAALEAARDGDDPVLLVLPADHVITRPQALLASLREGAGHAAAGRLVVFGVAARRAETGYGYLRAGAAVGGARKLEAFVEKPDAARAAEYVRSGNYTWNSGMFMLRASCWRELVARFRPDIAGAAERAWRGAQRDSDFVRLEKAAFLASPSESIDRAVAEPLTVKGGREAVVVALDAGWSDVGAWDALWEVVPQDERGNVVRGDVLLEDAQGTLVLAEGRLIAVVGTRDLVVVDTPDATMVAARDRVHDVKALVAQLKAKQRTEADEHRKVYRPWGHFDLLHAGPGFLVKSLVVKPGAALSLQRHHKRAEHWVVVRGQARVTRGEEQFELRENQSTYIPLGTKHRLENPGSQILEIVEVQSGSYIGEDDIERFTDQYGRT